MNEDRAAIRYLQAAAGLLIVLGVVHLAATSHIPELLRGVPAEVYERAVGPLLLNHVLVGILLIPLGFSTWLAAMASERGEVWALRVLVVNTIAVAALPVSVAAFMRRPEYYRAPLFLSGAMFAFAISFLMAIATVSIVLKNSHHRR